MVYIVEATLLNEAGLAPAPRVEADIGEAEAMYEAALGLSQMPQSRQAISLFDLLKVRLCCILYILRKQTIYIILYSLLS